MELPREIQRYIYAFLYDKWRIQWKKVMKEIGAIEIKRRILGCSGLWSTRWIFRKEMSAKMCIECGEYYRIPMYSCQRISCSCD